MIGGTKLISSLKENEKSLLEQKALLTKRIMDNLLKLHSLSRKSGRCEHDSSSFPLHLTHILRASKCSYNTNSVLDMLNRLCLHCLHVTGDKELDLNSPADKELFQGIAGNNHKVKEFANNRKSRKRVSAVEHSAPLTRMGNNGNKRDPIFHPNNATVISQRYVDSNFVNKRNIFIPSPLKAPENKLKETAEACSAFPINGVPNKMWNSKSCTTLDNGGTNKDDNMVIVCDTVYLEDVKSCHTAESGVYKTPKQSQLQLRGREDYVGSWCEKNKLYNNNKVGDDLTRDEYCAISNQVNAVNTKHVVDVEQNNPKKFVENGKCNKSPKRKGKLLLLNTVEKLKAKLLMNTNSVTSSVERMQCGKDDSKGTISKLLSELLDGVTLILSTEQLNVDTIPNEETQKTQLQSSSSEKNIVYENDKSMKTSFTPVINSRRAIASISENFIDSTNSISYSFYKTAENISVSCCKDNISVSCCKAADNILDSCGKGNDNVFGFGGDPFHKRCDVVNPENTFSPSSNIKGQDLNDRIADDVKDGNVEVCQIAVVANGTKTADITNPHVVGNTTDVTEVNAVIKELTLEKGKHIVGSVTRNITDFNESLGGVVESAIKLSSNYSTDVGENVTKTVFQRADVRRKTNSISKNDNTTDIIDGTMDVVIHTVDIGDGTTDIANGTTDTVDCITDIIVNTTDIADGTTDIGDGTTDIANGTMDMADGTTDKTDGTTDMADGTTDIVDDPKDIVVNTTDITDGTTQVPDNTPDMADGTSDMANGTSDMAGGASYMGDGTRDISGDATDILDYIAGKINSTTDIDNGAKDITITTTEATNQIANIIGYNTDFTDHNVRNNTMGIADHNAGLVDQTVDVPNSTVVVTGSAVEFVHHTTHIFDHTADFSVDTPDACDDGAGTFSEVMTKQLSNQISSRNISISIRSPIRTIPCPHNNKKDYVDSTTEIYTDMEQCDNCSNTKATQWNLLGTCSQKRRHTIEQERKNDQTLDNGNSTRTHYADEITVQECKLQTVSTSSTSETALEVAKQHAGTCGEEPNVKKGTQIIGNSKSSTKATSCSSTASEKGFKNKYRSEHHSVSDLSHDVLQAVFRSIEIKKPSKPAATDRSNEWRPSIGELHELNGEFDDNSFSQSHKQTAPVKECFVEIEPIDLESYFQLISSDHDDSCHGNSPSNSYLDDDATDTDKDCDGHITPGYIGDIISCKSKVGDCCSKICQNNNPRVIVDDCVGQFNLVKDPSDSETENDLEQSCISDSSDSDCLEIEYHESNERLFKAISSPKPQTKDIGSPADYFRDIRTKECCVVLQRCHTQLAPGKKREKVTNNTNSISSGDRYNKSKQEMKMSEPVLTHITDDFVLQIPTYEINNTQESQTDAHYGNSKDIFVMSQIDDGEIESNIGFDEFVLEHTSYEMNSTKGSKVDDLHGNNEDISIKTQLGDIGLEISTASIEGVSVNGVDPENNDALHVTTNAGAGSLTSRSGIVPTQNINDGNISSDHGEVDFSGADLKLSRSGDFQDCPTTEFINPETTNSSDLDEDFECKVVNIKRGEVESISLERIACKTSRDQQQHQQLIYPVESIHTGRLRVQKNVQKDPSVLYDDHSRDDDDIPNAFNTLSVLLSDITSNFGDQCNRLNESGPVESTRSANDANLHGEPTCTDSNGTIARNQLEFGNMSLCQPDDCGQSYCDDVFSKALSSNAITSNQAEDYDEFSSNAITSNEVEDYGAISSNAITINQEDDYDKSFLDGRSDETLSENLADHHDKPTCDLRSNDTRSTNPTSRHDEFNCDGQSIENMSTNLGENHYKTSCDLRYNDTRWTTNPADPPHKMTADMLCSVCSIGQSNNCSGNCNVSSHWQLGYSPDISEACESASDCSSKKPNCIQKTTTRDSNLKKLLTLYDQCENRHANYVIPSYRRRKSRSIVRQRPFKSSMLNNLDGLIPIRLDDVTISFPNSPLNRSSYIDLNEPSLKSTIKRSGRSLRKEMQGRRHTQDHYSKQLSIGYPLRDLSNRRLKKFKMRGFTLFPDLLNKVSDNKRGITDEDLALSRNAFEWSNGEMTEGAVVKFCVVLFKRLAAYFCWNLSL